MNERAEREDASSDRYDLIRVMPAQGGSQLSRRVRVVPTELEQGTSEDMDHVVVFTGGDAVPRAVAAHLPAGAFVIGADSGIEEAQALGWPIDLAIGDFDSVAPAALAEAERAGARVERHPTAKEATDLELALRAAADLEPSEIVVVGGAGGRLDHLLGGVLALTDPAYAGIRVRALVGPARLFVVRDEVELTGAPGELVTLLAIGGRAEGVTTSGLLYPLAAESLEPASTRGVSNAFVDPRASVSLTGGVLLAVLPGELVDSRPARDSSTDPPTDSPDAPGGSR